VLGLVAPAAIALAIALVMGGSLRGLFDARFRLWPLIGAAFAIELALYNPPIDGQPWARTIGPWLWLVLRAVIVAVLVLNGWSTSRAAWAWRIAALGVALNTVVIAVNGGHMPQSPDAAISVWGVSQIDPARLQNVSVMGPDTRLAWLGDVFAEPTWLPRRNVVSIGDMLLAGGTAWWVYASVRRGALVRAKIGAGSATSRGCSRRRSAPGPFEVR
jgi:Family of unknown function (DUF5317)